MTFGPPNSQPLSLPPEFSYPIDADQKQIRELTLIRERNTASILNLKTNGQFQTIQMLSGETWFSDQPSGAQSIQRYGYRIVYDIGTYYDNRITPGQTIKMPHGLNIGPSNVNIPQITAVTRLYGAALENGQFLVPIPYASATANDTIELYLDSEDVVVVIGSGQNIMFQCYIILEILYQ